MTMEYFPKGLLIFAPDGHYAAWGEYQGYLHLSQNQKMIPWAEAEMRWHKPEKVWQYILANNPTKNKKFFSEK